MKIIVASRGMGKTTQLISESAAQRYHLVVRSREMADIVFLKAVKMGKDIPFPITYDEFLEERYRGKHIKGFLIDDADALLERLSTVPIYTITLSGEL